jgi:hypothetical protein
MTDDTPRPPEKCPACGSCPTSWVGPKYVPANLSTWGDWYEEEQLEWSCVRCAFPYRMLTPRIARQIEAREAARRALPWWKRILT